MTTPTADIQLTSLGIIHVRIFDQAKQGLEDAKENMAACVQVGMGRKRPLLTDIRLCQPLTPEARRYYSGQALLDSFLAMAIVVDASPFGVMMGNTYMRIAKPGIPTRLFTNCESAESWLSGFLEHV